jgi:protein SCO1/2
MPWLVAVSLLMLGTTACRQAGPPERQYTLVGQVLAVAPERNEITIKHEDIKGFMPGMTMPFKVQDPTLLKQRVPGDLVTATLVIGEVGAHLSTLTRTGSAPVTDATPAPAAESLKQGDMVADAAFLDQAGAVRRLAEWRGHRVAMTFMYTRCPLPEFCPLMDRHFAAVQKELAKEPQFADVRLVSITMDPAFDTPAVLKAHAGRLGADAATWSLLAPEPAGAQAFYEQFGLIVERQGTGAGDITHNLRTVVLDADGKVSVIRTGNDWTPAQLIADIRATPRPRS